MKTVFVSNERILFLLDRMNRSADCFDLDGVDEALEELEKCKIPESIYNDFNELKAYVAEVDLKNIMSTARKMAQTLKSEGLDDESK